MQLARSLSLDKIILFIIIFGLCSSSAYSSETSDPIRNGGGARALGMGRAVTAVLDDVNSPFYNPAGLTAIKAAQFSGTYYTKVYGNYHYIIAGGATPTQYGFLGLSFVSTGTGQIPITTAGTVDSYAEYSDNLMFLTYANSLKGMHPFLRDVSYGINAKIFSKGTTGSVNYSATGYNFDVGLKYVPYTWLGVGVTKQNIAPLELTWNTGLKEGYPSPLMVGVYTIATEGRQALYSMDVEFPSYIYAPTLFHLGAEVPLDKTFTARFGYDQMHDAGRNIISGNPTAGLGINLKGFIVDYAYHPYYDDPGYGSHYVSISFNAEDVNRIFAIAGKDKRTFLPGESVDLNVTTYFRSNKVKAVAPDGTSMELNYSASTEVWRGSWVIPKFYKSEAYHFSVTAYDAFDVESRELSNDFFVKEAEVCPITEEGYVLYTPNDQIYIYDEKVNFHGLLNGVISQEVYVDPAITKTDACGEFKVDVTQKFGMNINFVSIASSKERTGFFRRNIVRFYIPEDLNASIMDTRTFGYRVICNEIRRYLGKRYSTNKPLTRELLALVITKANKISFADQPAPTAKDIVKGYWAAPFVSVVEQKGLIENFPDGTFKTDLTATIGQLDKAFGYTRGIGDAKSPNANATFGDMIDLMENSGILNKEISDYKAFLGNKY